VKEIAIKLRPAELESLHPDLLSLEQVHAKHAILTFHEQRQLWANGAAELAVEELSFSFSREKSTKTVAKTGPAESKTVGHQDIRRFNYEKYSATETAPGTQAVTWNRLSVAGEKTDLQSAGRAIARQDSACGKDQASFIRIRDRALGTIDFFQQVLPSIDASLLGRCATDLATIRQRVLAWTPIDQDCRPMGSNPTKSLPPTDVIVQAALLEEKAVTRKGGSTAQHELKVTFQPILFKHAQPTALKQTKGVLEDEGSLKAIEDALKTILAAQATSDVSIRLVVCGYADSTGNPDGQSGASMNLALSERRAKWVKQRLETKLGRRLDDVLAPHGCGDTMAPKGGHASPPHRAVIITQAMAPQS
jgi:outer membrane protein OmpA-like peptidoglycan-associated protein